LRPNLDQIGECIRTQTVAKNLFTLRVKKLSADRTSNITTFSELNPYSKPIKYKNTGSR